MRAGGRVRVYYKIDRTFVTDADGRSARQYDLTPILVPAESAQGAVDSFLVTEDGVQLLGNVTVLAGDKAIATLGSGRRVFVIFVQRAAEAIHRPARESRPVRE